MTNCPDDNDMACYIDGSLPDGEVKQLESHLLVCDRCRELVAVTKKVVAWIEG
jgi:anti-sigma factor RsiW